MAAMIFAVVTALVLVASASSFSIKKDIDDIMSEEGFSYDEQDMWGGVCVSGNNGKQSPINIVDTSAVEDAALPPLQLTGWGSSSNGDFTNTGHSVQFNPHTLGIAKTHTKAGVYTLQQIDMHWGSKKGEGSEHRIDGHASDLEIQFLHTKEDPKQPGPAYAIIGVLADAGVIPRLRPWRKLNPKHVKVYNSSVLVKKFQFDSLLPAKLDYYMYSGSLTTPPCTEEVLWHVMKQKVHVPVTYLQKLRRISDEYGHHDIHNIRETQQLNGRKVFTSQK